jgi:hypothetical protein
MSRRFKLLRCLCAIILIPRGRAQFMTCEEAVRELDALRSNVALLPIAPWEGGAFGSFAQMADARPAAISLAHPDWVGVLSSAVRGIYCFG